MSAHEPFDGPTAPSDGAAPAGSLRVNGTASDAVRRGASDHPTEVGAPDEGEWGRIDWQPSYEREAVERYLSSLDAQRARLEAEVADAERRAAAARDALEARTSELEARLGAVVLAARAELDRIDREQAEQVAAIHAAAEAEAARISAAARTEAEAVRQAAASLAALSRPHGPQPASYPSSFEGVGDHRSSEGWRDAR